MRLSFDKNPDEKLKREGSVYCRREFIFKGEEKKVMPVYVIIPLGYYV